MAMVPEQPDLFNKLAFLIGCYLLSELGYVIIFRFYDWIIIYFRPAMKRHIGLVLMDNMMEHAHSFYQRQFAGSLTTRMIDIMVGVPDVLRVVIDRLFGCLLMLVFALYNISIIHMKFAVALFVWVLLFLGISIFLFFRNQHLAYDVTSARALVTGYIVDIFTNMPTIRFFVGKKFEHDYLKKGMDLSVKSDQARDWFFFVLYGLQGVSFLIFQAVCCWWLLEGLIDKTISPGDFALILTLNVHIIENFWTIAKELRDLWEKMGNIVQGLAIIQAPVDIKDKPDAFQLTVPCGAIEFDNVTFKYKDTETLFEHRVVNIKPGEKIGLVGFSGSGKSTFINLILRVFDVTDGRIAIDGQNIAHVTQDSLHQAIGMIPQDPSLFHRSVYENIVYGRMNATRDEVIEAAKRAHAHEFIMTLSGGYDAQVGERGVKLSGGQRQRIVIARAILKNAPILILDEATSQLDSITESQIQDSLWDLMADKTTLIIAHRLSTLLHMDRILVFDKGTIIEDGSHDELLNKGGMYKKLWEEQIGGFLLDDMQTPADDVSDDQ